MGDTDQPTELSADDLDMAVGGHSKSTSTAKTGAEKTDMDAGKVYNAQMATVKQMAEENAKRASTKGAFSAEAKKKHA